MPKGTPSFVSASTAAPALTCVRPLSARGILPFYTPLGLNAVLMTLAGPVLNVALGHAHDPTLHLAAFWIAFTIVLFAQSACQALQQVTVALLGGRDSPATLAASALVAGLGAAVVVLIVARTPFGDVLFHRLIPTSAPVAQLAREVLARLAPIPVLVALRGVACGVAVVARRTTLLATATMVRIIALSAAVAVLGRTGPGALVAATAVLVGVVLETAFTMAATFPFWRHRLWGPPANAPRIAYRDVARMGVPLALAALLWTLTRPLANAILGGLPDPNLAQASFGVLQSIVWITCAPLWAFLEVTLVLPERHADLQGTLRLAAGTSLAFAAAIALLTLTPLRHLVLQLGFDLSPELERAVAPALALVVLGPFLLSARAIAQALLMRARRTGSLLVLAPVKILLMIAFGTAIVAARPDVNGATLAIGLVLGCDLTDAVLYGLAARRALARGLVFSAGRPPLALPTFPARRGLEPAALIPDAGEAAARRAA